MRRGRKENNGKWVIMGHFSIFSKLQFNGVIFVVPLQSGVPHFPLCRYINLSLDLFFKSVLEIFLRLKEKKIANRYHLF